MNEEMLKTYIENTEDEALKEILLMLLDRIQKLEAFLVL